MYEFEFDRASTPAHAVTLMRGGARALAGGQTLLASMKLRLASAEKLVDLGRIEGLDRIEQAGGALRIGAMARHLAVANNPAVRSAFPALADLASRIGDRQVRAMGTIGGSVANNDPAACYPSAVLACGATVLTDRREIAADDFFQGLFTTALEADELITGFRFPIPERAAYEKLRQQASHFPLVGVFVAKFARHVRVAITGGGNGVFRHPGLEQALTESFTAAAAARVPIDSAELGADLHASSEYRAHLVSLLCQRAVGRA